MLYTAAAVLVVLVVAHSVLGERFILRRLFRRPDLPKVLGSTGFTTGTLRFVWHLTSVMGLAIAAVLVQVQAGATQAAVVATLGWITLGSALLPLYFTRGKHLSWIGLAAVGALCLWWVSP